LFKGSFLLIPTHEDGDVIVAAGNLQGRRWSDE
jgi:hypothetical protein